MRQSLFLSLSEPIASQAAAAHLTALLLPDVLPPRPHLDLHGILATVRLSRRAERASEECSSCVETYEVTPKLVRCK